MFTLNDHMLYRLNNKSTFHFRKQNGTSQTGNRNCHFIRS